MLTLVLSTNVCSLAVDDCLYNLSSLNSTAHVEDEQGREDC